MHRITSADQSAADRNNAPHADSNTSSTGNATHLRRRGLVAGAAALAAALLTERVTQPVAAGSDGDLILNAANPGTSTTSLSANMSGGSVLYVTNLNTAGNNYTDGITGIAQVTGAAGVYGLNNASLGVGVRGDNLTGYGVYGYSNSYAGVYGVSGVSPSYGVYGASPSYGVFGTPSASGGAGLYGYANTASSYGVIGTATQPGSHAGYFTTTAAGSNAGYFSGPVVAIGSPGIGVNVTATASHAVVGVSSAAGYAGVSGQTLTANSYGVQGYAAAPGVYAGVFSGKVVVYGDFAVTGAKSAALPHPDGTHRLVYCVEAPESWLEDFGEGTLTGGMGVVKLDPEFVAVADTATLHVFCFEHGDNHSLHLSQRDTTGFTVAASADALAARGKKPSDANGTFSYRVVAKRKDLKTERLAKVTLPPPGKQTPLPLPSPGPKAPTLLPPLPPRTPKQ